MAISILSLDPATTTGFAYYDGKKDKNGNVFKHIKSGVWYCGKSLLDESYDMRIIRLEHQLNEIKKNNKLDLVVFEAARNATKNSQRALVTQAELQGVIKRWCMLHKIPYQGFSPSAIKKFATGNGNAKKELVVKAAKEKFKVKKIETNDQADALCLIHLAIDLYKDNIISFQEIVKRIDKETNKLADDGLPLSFI